MKGLSSLKFPAVWGTTPDMRVTEFKLGMGPCGKVVSALSYDIKDGFMSVFQRHTDGSYKTFTYRLSDIVGRIEASYE